MKSRIRAKHAQKPVSTFRKVLLSSAISSLSAVASQVSFAQDDELGFMLEEIVVTAQKRSESLQEVPIAVSAFSGDQLQSRGVLGGGDLQQQIPNVSFEGNTGFGAYNFQIRGIGAQIEGVAADSGVGVHINNAPVTVNRFTQSEFYDSERIEVLRGPQGTLYGRNATGGVVNILTAKPEDEYSAKLALEYGNYESKRVTGHLNVPISDTLAIRAAGFMMDREGTHYNTETGNDVESKEIWSGRLSVAWQPTDAISADFMWEHFEQDDTAGGSRKIICATDPGPESLGGVPTDPLTRLALSDSCLDTRPDDPRNNGHMVSGAGFAGIFANLGGLQSLNALDGRTYSSDLYTISSTLDPFTIAENDQVSLSLSFDITDGLTFTSLSAYSNDDAQASWSGTQAAGPDTERFAATPFNPTGVVNDPLLGNYDFLVNSVFTDQSAKQFSQELRLQSSFDGAFNFNIGALYLDLERENSVYVTSNAFTHFANVLNATAPAGAPPIAIDQGSFPDGSGRNYLNVSTDYNLKAAALFGEAYYDVNDEVKATLGLRYTEDKKDQLGAPIGFLIPGSGIPAGAVLQEETFRELTGRFTLDWQATDDTLLYASVSRGYKGGGFNPLSQDTSIPRRFEPELVDALELGSKSTIANGRGTLNLTGFYYDYKGYQISRITNNSPINENVDATVYGLELESVFAVTPDVTVNANIGYLNTEIADGVTSLDVYDRTQGDPNWTHVTSYSPASPGGGCVLPTAEVIGLLGAIDAGLAPSDALGIQCAGVVVPGGPVIPPSPNAIPGIDADVGGNDLPSSPELTLALGAQYDMEINSDWAASLRADYSYRSSTYSRIFNAIIDEVNEIHNLNLSVQAFHDASGVDVQLYVRNLLSEDEIVGNQPTGDTPGSYRIVRGKAPVFYGLRVSKSW